MREDRITLTKSITKQKREGGRQSQPHTASTRPTTQRTTLRHAGLRAVQLIVEPFQFLNFTQWDCMQAFNEHGTLKISGLIAEAHRQAYVDLSTRETWVTAKAKGTDGEDIILFTGILTDLTVESQHQFHTMRIEVATGSYLMDQGLHTRTFQPSETRYHEVIDTCLRSAGGQFTMRQGTDERTGQLTVQYRESNWSFIKRLAHRLGVVVLPEIKTPGKRLHLGLVQNLPGKEIQSDHFRETRKITDPTSLIRYEQGVFNIQTRDIYELGEAVNFQGRRLWMSEVKSELVGSELMHTYHLCTLKPAYEVRQGYDAIRGISMRAKVRAVERARVQVSIHEDENKQRSGQRWFEYATVYSTPDGTGFYAMPKVGDEVRVLFPNADESGAYVVSAVHLETTGGRTNPAHQSFKNEQNMEIRMTPNSIDVTTNRGSSIEVHDSRGITMTSDQDIFIEARKQLHISSETDSVTVYGERSLIVGQGAAQIHLQDHVDVSGGKINMN